jgi:hypothetical protein
MSDWLKDLPAALEIHRQDAPRTLEAAEASKVVDAAARLLPVASCPECGGCGHDVYETLDGFVTIDCPACSGRGKVVDPQAVERGAKGVYHLMRMNAHDDSVSDREIVEAVLLAVFDHDQGENE